MVKRYVVDGFEGFDSKIKELEALKETIFVMFSGSLNENGESWCPACQIAEPIVEEVLEKLKDNNSVHFLFVRVGHRPFWKDPHCVFRTDARLSLTCIPTLIKWGTNQRLKEEDFDDESKVEKFFNLRKSV